MRTYVHTIASMCLPATQPAGKRDEQNKKKTQIVCGMEKEVDVERKMVYIKKMHILNNIRSYLVVLRSSAATLSEVKCIMSFHFQRFPGGNATYRRIGMRLRRKMYTGEM